jgi:hypothetical protein
MRGGVMEVNGNTVRRRRARWLRLAAIAVGLVVAGLVIGGVSVASGSPSDRPNLQVVELISEATTINHFVDMGGVGPTPGDTYTFSDKLFFASNPDEQVGRADGNCTLIAPSARRFTCTVMSSLPEGDITVEHLMVFVPGAVSVGAVTGGTGAYRNARGEFTLTLGPVFGAPGARHQITASLILVP